MNQILETLAYVDLTCKIAKRAVAHAQQKSLPIPPGQWTQDRPPLQNFFI